MSKRLIFGLIGLSLMIAQAPVAAMAAPVGKVQLVKVWAYEKNPPGDWKDLLYSDPVFSDQWVRTVEDGALHVRFLDKTDLRLGAKSEAVIDRYIYDPARRRGELGLRLGRGVFRFITGDMNKNGVRIETPTAWIGVRGTDFVVHIAVTTVVQVFSGAVTITPKAPGGATTVVAPGQPMGVGPGESAASPANEPGVDYGLSGDAGVEPAGMGSGGGGGDGGGGGGGGY